MTNPILFKFDQIYRVFYSVYNCWNFRVYRAPGYEPVDFVVIPDRA